MGKEVTKLVEKKRGFSFYRLFLIVGGLALLCIILIIVGISAADNEDLAGVFGSRSLVRSETVYLTLLLALLLPVALCALTIFIAKEKVGFILFRDKEDETEEEGVRFHSLRTIDEEMKNYVAPAYQSIDSLRYICNDFRNFAAQKLGLFYEEDDIRKFVAGFAVSHLMIMQGLSGTGKTSLATAFGEYLNNRSTVISVQPMWRERADVIGYFNEFTKRFSESPLLKKLYEARYTDEIYIVVLDEVNIARVEYYFADFLSLMELSADNRYLEMTSDTWEKDPELFVQGRFRLPENVWFIGTANNDDSTFAVSDKVYDRAMVMNLDRKAGAFFAPETDGIKISFSQFRALTEGAERAFPMSEDAKRMVQDIDEFLMENYHITYGNRIRNQMEKYIAVYIGCGGTEQEALDDFLSKKILRKLEGQNPTVIAKASKALTEKLEDMFGENGMPLCTNYLKFLRQMTS